MRNVVSSSGVTQTPSLAELSDLTRDEIRKLREYLKAAEDGDAPEVRDFCTQAEADIVWAGGGLPYGIRVRYSKLIARSVDKRVKEYFKQKSSWLSECAGDQVFGEEEVDFRKPFAFFEGDADGFIPKEVDPPAREETPQQSVGQYHASGSKRSREPEVPEATASRRDSDARESTPSLHHPLSSFSDHGTDNDQSLPAPGPNSVQVLPTPAKFPIPEYIQPVQVDMDKELASRPVRLQWIGTCTANKAGDAPAPR